MRRCLAPFQLFVEENFGMLALLGKILDRDVMSLEVQILFYLEFAALSITKTHRCVLICIRVY